MKLVTLPALMVALIGSACADDRVQFNRDVRPILSEHCWQCHGFDEQSRQGGLRLDDRASASQPAESGTPAIVPGDASASELLKRVAASDPKHVMPPPDLNKPLSNVQIETLRRWIEEGAEFQKHWAFEPVRRPDVPTSPKQSHPIDAFVAKDLEHRGLTLAAPASRETLLRRVSFDLIGLPSTPEDLNRTDETYEQAVDRLLASPHFGERMAVDWLDAARYADTNGYFSDKPRQMWLWRDWVIDAFNANMRFDQFTIEQLAGDLLPNCTTSQRIATGFNRNHVANNETGIIDEEFRTEYVVDRVDTTMTTWLGLTAACAQCHDHKYDPISQREFYQLFAFFNNVPETGLIVSDNPPPLLTVTTPEQDEQLAALSAAAAQASQAFDSFRTQLATEITEWESGALQSLPSPPVESILHHETFDGHLLESTRHVGLPIVYLNGVNGQSARFEATSHAEQTLTNFHADEPWTIGFWILPDGSLSGVLSKIDDDDQRRGVEILWKKGHLIVNLVSRWGVDAIEVSTRHTISAGQWHHVAVCFDGSKGTPGLRIFVDGRAAAVDVHRDTLTGSISSERALLIGRRDSGLGYYGLLDELRIVSQSLTDKNIADWFYGERLRGILNVPAANRGARESDFVLDYYIEQFGAPMIRDARSAARAAQKAEKSFRDSIPTSLVMEEMPKPRETHVLLRGQYDQPGESVEPGVPSALSPFPGNAPANRLGFAHWLVDKENPLTARVAVNRFWKQCFGEGLVRTSNDFGTQGEPPTHPELLDWLASEFQNSGWDVKAMLKLIVTSQTYQQDSAFPIHGSAASDTQNRLLARGASFRLSAEMIRDQALAVSGLLKPTIGGPSVKPYQPAGLWEEVSYDAEDSYEEETGDGLWRRSLYTYLKRQVPPPSLLTFDGTTREKCTVQRARTNTPLQALNLLNDPIYSEASRALAALILQQNMDDSSRMNQLVRRVLSRSPDATEARLLLDLLSRQRERYSRNEFDADALLKVGVSKIPESISNQVSASELAAWTVVAHTLLNLDEAITRR